MNYSNGKSNRNKREFTNSFHSRLAEFWPVSRNQLHVGGWEFTKKFLNNFSFQKGQNILDICCGEGATACWLAKTYDLSVFGIDIVFEAVNTASTLASVKNTKDSCHFIQGDILSIPITNETFDFVYGQDPDGLAQWNKKLAFSEIFRVLKQGGTFGFHHWIPATGAPDLVVDKFDKVNQDTGFLSHKNVNTDSYLKDMEYSGFKILQVKDLSNLYRNHMSSIAENIEKSGKQPDYWTSQWLKLSRIHPFGVEILASKS